MRRPAPIAASIILLTLAIAACGDGEQSTPDACLGGSGTFGTALERSPTDARLADGVRISDCLIPNQPAGELISVGSALIKVTEGLNAAARATAGGPANVALGFLVGAVQRGAEQTGGIHADLLRRLETAARYSPGGEPLPAGFEASYEKGYAGGRDHG